MLGRYEVTRFLGRGGMGEVWLAEDTQLRRQIAVKLLPAAFAHDQQYLQAFEREARAAASLDHPNILPVHDFWQRPMFYWQAASRSPARRPTAF
jgi:serine/threonine protein kinase